MSDRETEKQIDREIKREREIERVKERDRETESRVKPNLGQLLISTFETGNPSPQMNCNPPWELANFGAWLPF